MNDDLKASDDIRLDNKRLQADLAEAMELLRAHGRPPEWLTLDDFVDWYNRYKKLLEKHKP